VSGFDGMPGAAIARTHREKLLRFSSPNNAQIVRKVAASFKPIVRCLAGGSMHAGVCAGGGQVWPDQP
jgi:hypothetical protein